jgi:uncharacterized membrane protein YfcA
MELDAFFFLMAVPAVVFAGMSKGGLSAAAGFAATPFLALILTPGQAIGLMLPLLLVMDVTALRAYWGKWDLKVAGFLVSGAVLGLIIAGFVYKTTDPDVFRFLIGVVAIGFVLYQGAKSKGFIRPAKTQMGGAYGLFWGAIAGFSSFVSHAGGPPASVYLLSQGFDKTKYHATGALAFFVINVLKIIPYITLGIFSADTLKADVLLLPAAMFGVMLGVYLHKRISERLFFTLTYTLLLCTGVKLIFDSLS